MCVGDIYSPSMGFKSIFNYGNLARISSCSTSKKVHALLGGKRKQQKNKRNDEIEKIKKNQRIKENNRLYYNGTRTIFFNEKRLSQYVISSQ